MKKPGLLVLGLLVLCLVSYTTVSAEDEDELLAVSPEAVSEGLVAYWPFNGNANDESGNGNHGTVVGATLCPDEKGVANKAYCFDGVDDYINIGTNVKPPFPFTIVAWVKPTSFGPEDIIFVNDLNGSGPQAYYGAAIGQYEGGRLFGFYGDGGRVGPASRTTKWTVSPVLQIGKWAHIAIKFNAHQNMDIYVNAVKQDGTWTGTGDSIQYSSSYPGAIGQRIGASGDPLWFNGAISEVRVYSRALSEAEIRELYTYKGDIWGCVQITALPAVGRKVIVRQSAKPDQVTTTDSKGCYAFEAVSHDTPLSIIIQSNWTPLLAPTTLQAQAVTKDRVNLTWRYATTDAESFELWRWKSPAGPWSLLTTTPGDTLAYSDITAVGNNLTTTYYYYVKPCNTVGCSPATRQAGVPYGVTGLTATPAAGKITLGWASTSTIETGFQIYRKSGACAVSNPWQLIHETAANATAYEDTAVTSGVPYSYKVRAHFKSAAEPYAHGYGLFSGCQSATAP